MLRPDTIAAQTPTADTLGYCPLDKAYIRTQQISGLILFAVLFAGAAIALVSKLMYDGLDWVWYSMLGGCVTILLLSVWSAVFWPGISYRRIRWKLDELGLEIHQGVIWRHRTFVPVARVQHADVTQGPIQRTHHLGTLTVHTAGTVNASVELPGLGHRVAMQLRDRLVMQRKVVRSDSS